MPGWALTSPPNPALPEITNVHRTRGLLRRPVLLLGHLADDLAALEAMAGAGITVSNGDGVAGNLTLALANDPAALEALAGTGFAVHTGVSTWIERSLTAPAAGITISNFLSKPSQKRASRPRKSRTRWR
jgi:hypothetical protein